MRRALGLYDDEVRPRTEGDRQEPAQRGGQGAFGQGGVHRRRFVQDGEVPVTVVRRDMPDAEHPGGGPSGIGQSGPTSTRLQQVEAALAAETASRERAERALHEAQAAVQALQTKIGHNELVKNDALGALKRHHEEIVWIREELAQAREAVAYSTANRLTEEASVIQRNQDEARDVSLAYEQVTDPATRKLVLDLIRSMATARAPQGQAAHADRVIAPAGEDRGRSVRQASSRPTPALAEALETARVRGTVVTSHLFNDPDMLSTAEMAKKLGMSEEGIRQKRKRHEILGIAFARRGLRYPAWQIRADRELLPVLPRLFEILGDDDWRIYRFLLQHHPEAGDERAVDALWHGKIEAVIAAADNIAAGAFA